jgi:hypothetical protein
MVLIRVHHIDYCRCLHSQQQKELYRGLQADKNAKCLLLAENLPIDTVKLVGVIVQLDAFHLEGLS